MTISIWRYSHLALAVSSFILLTLASVTGIILAFEPITQKVQPYRSSNFEQLTLAQTLPVLKKKYADISEMSVDANGFVLIKASDEEGEPLEVYVDAANGNILGKPAKKSSFFEWVTGLHRSLFLHETGRFIIGLTAFLLSLITISGLILVIQRQRGIKRFFAKIAKDSFAQYYHVVLGRLSLIPILVIAISGTYLSFLRFKLIEEKKVSKEVDFDAIRSKPEKTLQDIELFKRTLLSEVESVEFPFSEDVEDYYTLKLEDKELTVNQITGDILTEVPYSTATIAGKLSLDVHTGRTNAIWAIVLMIASGNILFFIYSGFAITLKRRKNIGKNKFKPEEARFVILVGSENGTTFKFAKAVQEQLLAKGEKSVVAELNNYKEFPKAEHLLIMTSTYGLGEAPSNASRFLSLLEKYPQKQKVTFSILGFGSHAYPDFCRYAYDVNNKLAVKDWASALLEVHTVNDKSIEEFNLWMEAWSSQADIRLEGNEVINLTAPPDLEPFQVIANSEAQTDETFLLRLKGKATANFTSGDLLAIYPANDHRERLYSIGKIGDELQLSVKLHENGLGSGYLHKLNGGEEIKARLVSNPHFHFPEKASSVFLISNGTGIAPFLGMIAQNRDKLPVVLYCGFRQRSSFNIFGNFLQQQQSEGRLQKIELALSREEEKLYVSNMIERDASGIAKSLAEGGVIMLCGSLSMQKDVITVLDKICLDQNSKSVSYYQSHGQILMDCY
ncbi:PepSY domain-containing protein [Desertivirga brevis]|uniref:PepSY domain-containing protein n=1 Tax=Desertivirga brevis TaxID=2810310 RepID=UPI001A961925|nr:PepSY domain-containing protein [Pedobacter sp. SYSU D00873]